MATLPGVAAGHGVKGETYTPWGDALTQQRAITMFASPDSAEVAALQDDVVDPLGTENMSLVGNSDKDGVTNSDLAFRAGYAYSGNYGGFRILDIRGQQPRELVDFACNGPQNDVSTAVIGGRTYLFQSIDTPQTKETCDSANAPLQGTPAGRVGYEGIRVFDVTNPTKPRFLDMVQTACGSHTHTLIQRGGTVYIYVASYPLGSNITPPDVQGPGEYRRCEQPFQKISVIRFRKAAQQGNRLRFDIKEPRLSDDTDMPPSPGSNPTERAFKACHDIQVFEPRDIAVGSCAGDAQIWSIEDPWNPTTDVEGQHTHIRSPSAEDSFEFIHNAVVTWDGKYVAITDETGGGGTANCFGSATTDGFYYFYPLVDPGEPEPELISRYTIPRNQGTEICVAHNGNIVPVRDRYVLVSAWYQGGTSVVDFTDVENPTEVAFSDREDEVGASDDWSSYWYNGRIYVNSGLNRRDATNRGFDVYTPDASLGLNRAKRWSWSNPQTQERRQVP